MLDFLVALIALGSGGGGDDVPQHSPPPPPALASEPQVATGQFTTALEVRPILDATRNSWVAVREFNGQDLVYITHLWSWRCGLIKIEFSVNGAPLEDWPMPPCYLGTATPNAVTGEDGLPYRVFPLGSVAELAVRITYDDLGTDEASWQRRQILIP